MHEFKLMSLCGGVYIPHSRRAWTHAHVICYNISSLLTIWTLINNRWFVQGLNIGGKKYEMPSNWASETLSCIYGFNL